LGGAGGSTLTANLITANEAGCGGGLALVQGSAVVQSNVIASNEAGSGGGLCLEDHSDVLLVNNWIVDNQALYDGGGLLAADSRLRLAHNTIARNAGHNGLYVGSYTETTSAVILTDTILVSHTVGVAVTAGNTASLEATLWGNDTDWAGAGAIYTGTVNVWGDPAFADPGAGDYHIGPGSVAVDAGVSAGVTTDIDGDPRPMDAGYDIGADELRPRPVWFVYLPLVLRAGD
jgi:fibronectin-binding autotransporter adhesin